MRAHRWMEKGPLIGAADHRRSDPIYLHRLFDAVVPRVRAATSWSRLDRRVSDPAETIKLFLWSWSTAAFYIAAIMGALWVRNTRVAKREWFDINNLDRARPILRYVTPTLIGTAFGCATLFIIALVEGPGFETSFKSVGEVMHQSLPWFPLAMVMAFVAVVLSDANLSDGQLRWRKILIRGMCGGLAMALVGLLTGSIIIPEGIESFARARSLVIDSKVHAAGIEVILFIAVQIGLIASVLCVSIQVSEFYTLGSRCLAGKHVAAVTRQGPVFSMFFDPAGHAALLSTDGAGTGPSQALCQGEWQQFPEGTAVKWTTGKEEDPSQGGRVRPDFGLRRFTDLRRIRGTLLRCGRVHRSGALGSQSPMTCEQGQYRRPVR